MPGLKASAMRGRQCHLTMHHSRARSQRGIAALVVVMVLFFIISLVAAYTGRNLIFEQRTSANQYKATQAFEAADAGLQWVLAMLNSGRIGNDCQPSVNVADTSFRQRYLDINPSNGNIKPLRTDPDDGVWPSCVFNGVNWVCDCPATAAPALAAPAGAGQFPAFRVRFVKLGYLPPAPAGPSLGSDPPRPTIVRVEVNGCAQLDDACLNFRVAPSNLDWLRCQATVCAQVALHSGLKSRPVAAVTVRGGLDLGGAALTANNSSPGTSGITIQAGGLVNPAGLVLQGAAGTRADRTVVDNDMNLAALDPARMFASIFGVWRASYWLQPSAVTAACAPCSAAQVRAAVALNPGRVILVPADLALEGGADIGSAAEPVVLVVSGNITFTAPTTVYGFVYSEAATWTTSGIGGLIQGAVAGQGNMAGSGSPTVVYDKQILDSLYWRTGTFVTVPGSWMDFQ